MTHDVWTCPATMASNMGKKRSLQGLACFERIVRSNCEGPLGQSGEEAFPGHFCIGFRKISRRHSRAHGEAKVVGEVKPVLKAVTL